MHSNVTLFGGETQSLKAQDQETHSGSVPIAIWLLVGHALPPNSPGERLRAMARPRYPVIRFVTNWEGCRGQSSSGPADWSDRISIPFSDWDGLLAARPIGQNGSWGHGKSRGGELVLYLGQHCPPSSMRHSQPEPTRFPLGEAPS